jgi:hypothetical protein
LKKQHKDLERNIEKLERRFAIKLEPDCIPFVERTNQIIIKFKDKYKENYEEPNGLLGGNGDIFLKLAVHHWVDDDDLKQMFEVSSGLLSWRNHFLFRNKRPLKTKPNTTNI